MSDYMKQEYSDRFDELRKNRVAVSYHKYGSVKKIVIAAVIVSFILPLLATSALVSWVNKKDKENENV